MFSCCRRTSRTDRQYLLSSEVKKTDEIFLTHNWPPKNKATKKNVQVGFQAHSWILEMKDPTSRTVSETTRLTARKQALSGDSTDHVVTLYNNHSRTNQNLVSLSLEESTSQTTSLKLNGLINGTKVDTHLILHEAFLQPKQLVFSQKETGTTITFKAFSEV